MNEFCTQRNKLAPLHQLYFGGKRPGVPECNLNLHSLSEQEFFILFFRMLRDSRLDMSEKAWWFKVLEYLMHYLTTDTWCTVQKLFFKILNDLKRKKLKVGNNINQYVISYFTHEEKSKEEAPPPHVNLIEKQLTETAVVTIFFCRYYLVARMCPHGEQCSFQHACIICFKESGKILRHDLTCCRRVQNSKPRVFG